MLDVTAIEGTEPLVPVLYHWHACHRGSWQIVSSHRATHAREFDGLC